MRLATFASALAIVLCVAVFGAIFWQNRPVPAPEPAQATTTEGRAPVAAVRDMDNPAAGSARAAEAPAAVAQAAAPLASAMPASCSNPDALGVSRVVEIDTTGRPRFGFEPSNPHPSLPKPHALPPLDHSPRPQHPP